MKKLLCVALAVALVASLIAGCGGGGATEGTTATTAATTAASASESTTASSGGAKTYVLVGKDASNPYFLKEDEGFKQACAELGVEALYQGPDQATPEKQIEVINALVARGVSGIAVSANDADALQTALKAAMDKGIAVISTDSAVNAESRQTHANQADPEAIGRTLAQAASEIAGEGGIAVLSATPQATNQNIWIHWMKMELSGDQDDIPAESPDTLPTHYAAAYEKTPLVKVVFGNDDPTDSTNQMQALLADPTIKVVVAPTTVGILAAGKLLEDQQSDVKITGLGLPSEMKDLILNGTCPKMFLWNPADLGYLTAYALDGLVNGSISGAVGETLDLPNEVNGLTSFELVDAGDGGSEIRMGAPFEFNPSNIEEWAAVY